MKKIQIAIVVAPYHPSARLMVAHIEEAVRGLEHVSLMIHEVSGSFEIPLRTKWMLKLEHVDAVIALGAIERGETGHGEALAGAVFPALMALSLEFEKPVGLGIIGPNATREQIESRAKPVALEAIKAVLAQLA